MAVRLLAYVGLLYQDLIRARQFAPEGRLPPVVPVVLYNGRPRWMRRRGRAWRRRTARPSWSGASGC